MWTYRRNHGYLSAFFVLQITSNNIKYVFRITTQTRAHIQGGPKNLAHFSYAL